MFQRKHGLWKTEFSKRSDQAWCTYSPCHPCGPNCPCGPSPRWGLQAVCELVIDFCLLHLLNLKSQLFTPLGDAIAGSRGRYCMDCMDRERRSLDCMDCKMQ